jgi:hypothetical protein
MIGQEIIKRSNISIYHWNVSYEQSNNLKIIVESPLLMIYNAFFFFGAGV